MSQCLVCQTEIVLNEKGECSYCAESRRQGVIFAKDHPQKIALFAENYYSPESNRAFFSVSQFKDFEKCPACAVAKVEGWRQPPSTAMLVGSYVDAHFEGTLSLFKAQHPEILNSRTGELKADFQQANQIIQRAEGDAFFMKYMEGEKQSVFTGDIDGVLWKVKTENLRPEVHAIDGSRHGSVVYRTLGV